MARKVEPRYAVIEIKDEMETISDARLRVRTDIPMKWLRMLDLNDAATVEDFMLNVIQEWEGFDLPLDREGMGELTVGDMKALSVMVMDAIQNPQKATNAASL